MYERSEDLLDLQDAERSDCIIVIATECQHSFDTRVNQVNMGWSFDIVEWCYSQHKDEHNQSLHCCAPRIVHRCHVLFALLDFQDLFISTMRRSIRNFYMKWLKYLDCLAINIIVAAAVMVSELKQRRTHNALLFNIIKFRIISQWNVNCWFSSHKLVNGFLTRLFAIHCQLLAHLTRRGNRFLRN